MATEFTPGSLKINCDYRECCGLPRKAYLIISAIIIISMAWKLAQPLYFQLIALPYDDFCWSEFLINFEGGFVRRGLIGELLYFFSMSTGLQPAWIFVPVCVIAYIFVTWFLYNKFKGYGIIWWLVFSPLLCGHTTDLIRKDYIMYCFIIGVFTILKKYRDSTPRNILVTLLIIIGLLIHEAFIFYALPIVALKFYSTGESRHINLALIATICLSFLTLCHFKGDQSTALTIHNSWKGIIPDWTEFDPNQMNSIYAIGWESINTFKFHLKLNFVSPTFGLSSILFRLIGYMFVYYFAINAPVILRSNTKSKDLSAETIGATFLVLSFCLIPMFTILSCDYARLYQYITVTTACAYIILGHRTLTNLLPKRIISISGFINRGLNRFLIPNKALLLFMLFAFCPSGNSAYSIYEESLLGSLCGLFGYILHSTLYSLTA